MKDKTRREWTLEDIQFLKENLLISDKQIALRLNRTINSVRNKRKRLDFNKKDHAKYFIDLNFFKNWNNEMAYILGYIFADGCIRIRNSSMELSIKSKDFEILEKMNNVIKSNYQISKELTKTGIIFRLSIYRKEVIRDLLNLGLIPRKSLTMIFPDVPKKYLFHFIRGFFDGDGCVRILRNSLEITFTSGSKLFLEGLKKNLEKLGIQSGILSPFNYSFHVLKIYKENRDFFVNMLYNNTNLFLQRKKNIFQQFYHNFNCLKIICIDCKKEVVKTGKNQKRCESCANQKRRELNRISYRKRMDKTKDKKN